MKRTTRSLYAAVSCWMLCAVLASGCAGRVLITDLPPCPVWSDAALDELDALLQSSLDVDDLMVGIDSWRRYCLGIEAMRGG